MKHILALITALFLSIGLSFAAVNVNTATQAELQTLDGIGPVKAKAIIDYRTKNGPFKSIDDLEKVTGIGQSTLKDIRKDVTLTGASTAAAGGKGGEKKDSAKGGDKKDAKADAKSDSKGAVKKDAKADAKADSKGAVKKDAKADAKSDGKISKDASSMKSGSTDSSKDAKPKSEMKKSDTAADRSKADDGKTKSMKKDDKKTEASK